MKKIIFTLIIAAISLGTVSTSFAATKHHVVVVKKHKKFHYEPLYMRIQSQDLKTSG